MISYTREQLFDFKQHGEGKKDIDILPPEIREQLGDQLQWRDQLRRWRRKRGKRGGIRRKLQRRKTKLPLPTILLENVRSLRNRIDELNINIRFLKEYRDACILCFTETWLFEDLQNDILQLNGFLGPMCAERDLNMTGKKMVGGVCFYINER